MNIYPSTGSGGGSTTGGAPVGSIVQAPYNLTDPDWLPCDGRKVSRSQYPLLSACLPSIGTFTATSRSMPNGRTSSAIANNGTRWVVTNLVGTNNLYETTDGITYNAATTPATTDVRSILYDGTNFVAVSVGVNPIYSSTGTGTWSTSASAIANAPTSGLQTCMTWASSLGTVGRFCLARGDTSFATSDDRGVTWTQRAHGLGGNVFHVCWTGQKFIATTGTANVIYTSADGITWASQYVGLGGTATTTNGSIISDGNGKVMWMWGSSYAVLTSLDHGTTWSARYFGGYTAAETVRMTNLSTAIYTNGRFCIISGYGWLLMSTDLIGWVEAPSPSALFGYYGALSYKSGVYLANCDNASTAALTLVEDATYMRLPQSAQNFQSISGVQNWNNYMPFIKVA